MNSKTIKHKFFAQFDNWQCSFSLQNDVNVMKSGMTKRKTGGVSSVTKHKAKRGMYFIKTELFYDSKISHSPVIRLQVNVRENYV